MAPLGIREKSLKIITGTTKFALEQSALPHLQMKRIGYTYCKRQLLINLQNSVREG